MGIQASAAWKLANFVAFHKPVAKRVVHINMDESCVKMYTQSRTPGLVYAPRGVEKRKLLEKK